MEKIQKNTKWKKVRKDLQEPLSYKFLFYLLNADRDIQSRTLALGPLKEKTKHNKHNKMYIQIQMNIKYIKLFIIQVKIMKH